MLILFPTGDLAIRTAQLRPAERGGSVEAGWVDDSRSGEALEAREEDQFKAAVSSPVSHFVVALCRQVK